MIVGSQEKVRYFLKRPGSSRKKFQLVAYTLKNRSTKVYQKLSPHLESEVAAVNQKLDKVLNQQEAETLLNDLIQKEYQRFGIRDMVIKNSVLSEVNQKIFNSFWSKIYSHKELVDEESARYDFLKAIRLVEPLSLMTASTSELRKKLKQNATSNEIRRAVDRLNQIFKFLGRDVRLFKPEAELTSIRYLTESEFNKVLSHIEDSILKDLATTLFCSGLRISEAMALKESDFLKGTLNVSKQLTRHSKLKAPKRGKKGRSLVVPFGIEAVKRWVRVDNKSDYREPFRIALAKACAKEFPKSKSKWISPHDLRHSHAIYLLGKGASLTQVALNLRNRIEVCQKYYTGFAHTEDSIEYLKTIFE